MKLTKLFGKQVFALYEGEIVGTIVDVNYSIDFSKIASLKIFDNEEVEYEIKFANIKAINDCVIIANKNKLNPYIGKKNQSPIFKQVIDQNATDCGKIIDCEIDNSGKIINYTTDTNHILTPENIYLRNAFAYYCTEKFIAKNLKPKNPKLLPNKINVSILNIEDTQNTTNIIPNKLQFNPRSLIGKMAKDTLLGLNNEVIIKANQMITEKTLTIATRHNRLNQLYFLAV